MKLVLKLKTTRIRDTCIKPIHKNLCAFVRAAFKKAALKTKDSVGMNQKVRDEYEILKKYFQSCMSTVSLGSIK